MRKLSALAAIVMPTLLACGSNTTTPGTTYSTTELTRYKAALPSETQLTAATPQASTTRAVAQSQFPTMARDAVKDINGVVSGIVALMRAIIDLPPTVYNSETHEFVWGPWANDTDFGNVAAYIKEQLPVAKAGDACPSGFHVDAVAANCAPDFRFVYALLRGVGNDVATYTPVIWGGANPDATNPDFGSGVTLWDFDANYAFAQAHDPAYATRDFAHGRFVALYGKGLTDDTTDPASSTFAFNVVVFRNFVPQDKPNENIDAEYFYGLYQGAVTVGFVNFHTQGDVDAASDPSHDPEDLSVRIAFMSSGVGRAEATIKCPTGASCSLPTPTGGLATECWDTSLAPVYTNLTVGAWSLTTPPTATQADCGPVFENTLDALKIPSLDSISPDLMAILDKVAENGMPTGN